MSTSPLYLFLLFVSPFLSLSLCFFQVSCAFRVLILTACFSAQSAEFSRLSLPICYLIFQCEVFVGVVATGSATGIGAW